MSDLSNLEQGMLKKNKGNTSPNRALAILTSIFFVELTIMVVFFTVPPLPPVTGTLFDATILILIVSPIVYRFAIVPLYEQMAKTNDAVNQLESLNLDLEKRIRSNTGSRKGQRRKLASYRAIRSRRARSPYHQLYPNAGNTSFTGH